MVLNPASSLSFRRRASVVALWISLNFPPSQVRYRGGPENRRVVPVKRGVLVARVVGVMDDGLF